VLGTRADSSEVHLFARHGINQQLAVVLYDGSLDAIALFEILLYVIETDSVAE